MTIDEIHRIVVAANPVPDPEMLEPVPLPDLLEEPEGSIDMTGTRHTQTKEGNDQTPRDSRLIRRWPAIAAAALAVALIAGMGLVRLGEPNEGLIAGEAPGVFDDFVAALQDNDVEAASALLVTDLATDFTPWLVGTDTSSLRLTECEIDSSRIVRCTADYGPNWFYSRITGEEMVSSIVAGIEDDGLDLIAAPPPTGLYTADREFGTWVLETHPERYDEMYLDDAWTIKNGYQSGAARSELADEYLASRG